MFPIALISAAPTAKTQGIAVEEATAVARIDAATSRIEDFGSDLQVELALSQAVPWRVFTLDEPMRLVADFGEVDFDGADLASLIRSDQVKGVTYGRYREGWSRLVLVLASPMRVETAGVGTGRGAIGSASLKMSLAPTSRRDFVSSTGAPESGVFQLPKEGPAGRTESDGQTTPLRVVIDAGSGLGNSREWDDPLLGIARDLALGLKHDGHDVTLKRDTVPALSSVDLDEVASEGDADVVLSLMVDPETSEALTTEKSPGKSLVLTNTTATVPSEAALRGERLAAHLIDGFARHTDDMLQTPRLRAGFSVRQADEMQSVRVELGFAGEAAERAGLDDPLWRIKAVTGIREAFGAWTDKDAGAFGGR